MRTDLVEEALEHGCRSRGSLAGVIFHSDYGSVYTSSQFFRLGAGACRSLSRCARLARSVGNSLAESCNATLGPTPEK